MAEKPENELWVTPQELEDHIRAMHENAEREFQEKMKSQLKVQIEDALRAGKKH